MSHGGGGDDIGIALSIGAVVAIGALWLAAVFSRNQSGLPTSYRSAQAPLAEHQTAPVEQLTSSTLAQLKKLIEETRSENAKIQAEIRVARNRLGWAKVRRSLAILLLSPLFAVLLLILPVAKKLYFWTRRMVARLEEEIGDLNAKLSAAAIALDFDSAPEVTAAFDDLETAFEGVRACNAKWDITTEWQADQFHWRTTASRSLERKPVELARGDGPYIKSSRAALIFGNVTERQSISTPVSRW